MDIANYMLTLTSEFFQDFQLKMKPDRTFVKMNGDYNWN
jgi:hypothetical protein